MTLRESRFHLSSVLGVLCAFGVISATECLRLTAMVLAATSRRGLEPHRLACLLLRDKLETRLLNMPMLISSRLISRLSQSLFAELSETPMAKVRPLPG